MSGVGAVVGGVRPISETVPKESTASAVQTPAPAAEAGPSAFARLVHGLGAEVNSGEATMRSAAHLGASKLDPEQLIALQAGVYRYSEVIDLASKLVDHAVGSVKTVVQGGGQ